MTRAAAARDREHDTHHVGTDDNDVPRAGKLLWNALSMWSP